MFSRLCFSDLHDLYRNGASPAELLREIYHRIADVDDPEIFLDLLPIEHPLEQAQALGSFDPVLKPLWGIPFAVKDNIDVAGRPTTAGCTEFAYTPNADAVCVSLLKQAGAIVIGKTNLDQFATGLVGLRTMGKPPRNAIDQRLAPGGSSSGSAVAVAHGLLSFALGTDTAGSGRVPAAFNNIVGLKPTLGRISSRGVVPACRSLDTVSIFALCCEDAGRVLSVLAEFDPADPFSREDANSELSGLPQHPTVGIPSPESLEFFGDRAQEEAFSRAIELIQATGARIQTLNFSSFFETAHLLYEGAWVAERYTVISELLAKHPDAVHPTVREIVRKAENFSAADTFKQLYDLQRLRRQTASLMSGIDALCVPSVPQLLTVEEVAAEPIETNSRLGTYSNFVNLLYLCGLTVPTGLRSDGLPGSVTLLARQGTDAHLAALGARVHRLANVQLGATAYRLPNTQAPALPAGEHELELAVVGAHMSGLQLNAELTRLGARFLRAIKTAPIYRLYRLPGGPPQRPGMVRCEAGSAIALETWAIPRTRFAEFIAGVPAPLSIGTVALETGEAVKGFLCETAGLENALDITEFGGWRAFLAR